MSARFPTAASPATLIARRRCRHAGGDGASRPTGTAAPTLVVPMPAPSAEARAAAAWRSRVDACHAEARAALRIPFSPPTTWEP